MHFKKGVNVLIVTGSELVTLLEIKQKPGLQDADFTDGVQHYTAWITGRLWDTYISIILLTTSSRNSLP